MDVFCIPQQVIVLRQELQQYFDNHYPGSKIDTEHSIFGPVHIRFELGGELKNGTKERVQQATQRAAELYSNTFTNPSNDIWILAYDYLHDDASTAYLRSLFSSDQFSLFHDQEEEVNTRFSTTDEQGNEIPEKASQRIMIGKLPVTAIPAARIFEGIANYEMGFEPYLDQRIIFIDPVTHRALLMYDDRGCYVWSINADNIRPLYTKYNDWIVDYHRPEIDDYFK